MERHEIESIIKDKGISWTTAAMIEGSIGYHSPKHAFRLIMDYLHGEYKSYCERCVACFKEDLEAMISYDIEIFMLLEARDPEKVQRIIKFVSKIDKLSNEDQTTIGLAYPTTNI